MAQFSALLPGYGLTGPLDQLGGGVQVVCTKLPLDWQAGREAWEVVSDHS